MNTTGKKGKWVVVENPHSEWVVHFKPEMALVSIPKWKKARKRLAAMRAANPNTGRKRSRNECSATTLFSGTLFCAHCYAREKGSGELKLVRSTPQYKQLGCINAPASKHGCDLTSSKSTRIVEECLLNYIQSALFTPKALGKLVTMANDFLAKEAKKPRANVAPQKAQLKRLTKDIEKLFERIENCENDNLCAAYDKRITQKEKIAEELRGKIRDANVNNRQPPPPLDLERVKLYVEDLRSVLNQEIPAAADAIRLLTGPIRIRQEKIPGRKRGARWIATFEPNLVRLLRQVASDKDYPDSVTLEFLNARNWITSQTVEVVIEKVPKYELLAPKFLEMKRNGYSVQTIATHHKISWQFADEILHFAETGERPKWKGHKNPGTRKKGWNKFKKHQPEIVRLKKEEDLNIPQIIERFKDKGIAIGESTVRRSLADAREHGVKSND